MKKTLLMLLVLALGVNSMAAESVFTKFVYRDGDKLMDENGQVRFIGFNIPCLHYNEDNMLFTKTSPWRLTNEFEIADALEAVKQMGGRVVRIYALSVKKPGEDPNIPRHITGPGEFNEEAFESLDMALAIANRKGIRIIFPFIDNWRWWGGLEAYPQYRGKTREDFWTDEELFEDYKKIVSYVVNRTNSVTGVKYIDDKAILAWETGNELTCPHEWTAKAAAYIKSIDKNHLVIDGYHTITLRDESIEDENIDIVTTHHYPKKDHDIVGHIKNNIARTKGKKPYFVGEFGFVPTDYVEKILQAVIDSNASGILIWSLRFRNRDGGFCWHTEPHGNDLYKAYHWPGFSSNALFDEAGLLTLMRAKAFEIRGLPTPPIDKPAPPVLLDIADVAAISWQGSAGAESYTVERAAEKNGPWQTAANDISDAALPYRPLFNDTGVEIGKSYYYRVIAKNSGGVSEPSNIVGPVLVSYQTLVDEMLDMNLIHKRKGALKLKSNEARKAKEDFHRLAGKKWAGIFTTYIIYEVEAPINSWKVYSFFPKKVSDFRFYASADSENFEQINFERKDYFTGEGYYGYYLPVLYQGDVNEENAKYLKIEFTGGAQIARVEIKYGKQN